MSKAFQCDCCLQLKTYPPTVDRDLKMDLCHECLAMVHEIKTRLEFQLEDEWKKRTVQYGLTSLREIDIMKMIDFLYTNSKDEFNRLFKGTSVIPYRRSKDENSPNG